MSEQSVYVTGKRTGVEKSIFRRREELNYLF